jgi:hypothetical protein
MPSGCIGSTSDAFYVKVRHLRLWELRQVRLQEAEGSWSLSMNRGSSLKIYNSQLNKIVFLFDPLQLSSYYYRKYPAMVAERSKA